MPRIAGRVHRQEVERRLLADGPLHVERQRRHLREQGDYYNFTFTNFLDLHLHLISFIHLFTLLNLICTWNGNDGICVSKETRGPIGRPHPQ